MKITWLILIVALTFLPTLLAGAKKARVGRVIETDNDDSDNDEDTNDDGFFSFDDEEPAEEAVKEPSYFTYETLEPETKQAPAPVQVAVEEPLQRPVFDLRQAIIYQTVLDNRYINAEN